MGPCMPLGKVFHFAPRLIGNVDLRLVPHKVGNRTDKAHFWIMQVTKQSAEPAGGHNRVIVEQNQVLSLRDPDPLIISSCEATVLRIQDDPYVRMLISHV